MAPKKIIQGDSSISRISDKSGTSFADNLLALTIGRPAVVSKNERSAVKVIDSMLAQLQR